MFVKNDRHIVVCSSLLGNPAPVWIIRTRMATLISSCGYCYSGCSVVWISHGVSVSFHIPSGQDTSLHSSSFILVRWGRNLLFRLSWQPLPLDLEDSILRVFHLHLGVVAKPNEVSDRE